MDVAKEEEAVGVHSEAPAVEVLVSIVVNQVISLENVLNQVSIWQVEAVAEVEAEVEVVEDSEEEAVAAVAEVSVEEDLEDLVEVQAVAVLEII